MINGVAVDLKAKWIMRLAKVPGLVVTVDAPVEATGTAVSKLTNSQLWPYVSGNAKLWGSRWQPAPDAPTIAIVDSGLDAGKKDFAGRAYPQVNLSSTHAERNRATATATAPSWRGSPRAGTTATPAPPRPRTSSRSA